MKNIKTFMLSTAAALCLSTGIAAADSTSYSQPNEQQREYRTPLKEMRQNEIYRERQDTYQTRRAYDNDAQYNADHAVNMRADANKAGQDIRWGTTANSQTKLSAGELQQVQRRLREAGHSVSVDGIWGPETAGAVRDFQQERDLAVSGKLDARTLSELNVSTSLYTRENR